MTLSSQPGGSTLLALAALTIWPCLILTDTVMARLGGWDTHSRLEQSIVAGCLLWMIGVVICLIIPAIRRRFRSSSRRIALLVGGLSAGLLLGETVTAFAFEFASESPFHLRRPNLKIVSHPKPGIMPGIDGPSVYSTNLLGVRGPVRPTEKQTRRILCVGGSTTECFYLDDEEAWPNLLMQKLNAETGRRYWVGNVGMSGYDTRHHLEFLSNSKIVGEVDFIVMLVGGNDFHGALQGETRVLVDTQGPRWSRSSILAAVRSIFHRRAAIEIEDSAGEVYEQRRRRRYEMQAIDSLPDLESAIDAYRERISTIANLCREKNVRLLCLTQPVLWRADLAPDAERLLWMGWNGDRERIEAGALRRGMDRFNQALIQSCARLDIPCIDLESMSGITTWFYDDMHFNEAGAREVARRVAEWLLMHDTDHRDSP